MNGTARGCCAQPDQQPVELILRVGEIALKHDAGRRAVVELRVRKQLEYEFGDALARVERLHIHVQVGAHIARQPQQRQQAFACRLQGANRCVRTQVRRERRDLDAQVCSWQRTETIVLEQGLGGPGRAHRAERAQRLSAAHRVGIAFALGQCRLAEKVERHAATALPQRCQLATCRGSVLTGDEPVRHCSDSERRGRGRGQFQGAPPDQRREPPRGLRIDGRLLQVLIQVANELGTVPAGRAHIDEAKQRGPQPRVADDRLHHPPLDRRGRVAPAIGQVVGEAVPPAPHLCFKVVSQHR